MAQEFITIFSGPDQWAALLLSSAGAELSKIGFRPALAVRRESFDPEEPAPDETITLSDSGSTEKLLTWTAASLEFQNDDLPLHLTVARSAEKGFSNTFVRIDVEKLQSAAAAGRLDRFYDAMATIAVATGSTAGFGRAKSKIAPISPRQARTRIAASALGLLLAATVSADEAKTAAGTKFALHSLPGCWVLTDQKYFAGLGAAPKD